MSDLTSADRLVVLTEMLTSMSGNGLGNIGQLPRVSEILEKMSPEGIEILGSYAGEIDQIAEEALRGSYDVNDLKMAISNLITQADDVDGNVNNISIMIASRVPIIEEFTSAEDVDHKALFQEVLKVGLSASAGDLMNIALGNRPQGEQGALEISEFQGGLQAMMVVAMNVAQDNGVDVEQAMKEVQEQQKTSLVSTFDNADGEKVQADGSDCTVEKSPVLGMDDTITCKL